MLSEDKVVYPGCHRRWKIVAHHDNKTTSVAGWFEASPELSTLKSLYLPPYHLPSFCQQVYKLIFCQQIAHLTIIKSSTTFHHLLSVLWLIIWHLIKNIYEPPRLMCNQFHKKCQAKSIFKSKPVLFLSGNHCLLKCLFVVWQEHVNDSGLGSSSKRIRSSNNNRKKL